MHDQHKLRLEKKSKSEGKVPNLAEVKELKVAKTTQHKMHRAEITEKILEVLKFREDWSAARQDFKDKEKKLKSFNVIRTELVSQCKGSGKKALQDKGLFIHKRNAFIED